MRETLTRSQECRVTSRDVRWKLPCNRTSQFSSCLLLITARGHNSSRWFSCQSLTKKDRQTRRWIISKKIPSCVFFRATSCFARGGITEMKLFFFIGPEWRISRSFREENFFFFFFPPSREKSRNRWSLFTSQSAEMLTVVTREFDAKWFRWILTHTPPPREIFLTFECDLF